MGELAAGLGDRHHEAEVEEEFERGGGAVRLVPAARGHPPDRPVVPEVGLGPGLGVGRFAGHGVAFAGESGRLTGRSWHPGRTGARTEAFSFGSCRARAGIRRRRPGPPGVAVRCRARPRAPHAAALRQPGVDGSVREPGDNAPGYGV
ncbi:hypothetical protein GCM10025734_33620 [Kitasatospora paranensis]